MFLPFRQLSFASIAGISLIVLSGCDRSDPPEPAAGGHAGHDHGHEEMPATFAEAVADLKVHAPEIKEAYEAGTPENVHDELHHVAHLLEEMPALIDDSNLAEELKAEAKEVSDGLFDHYTKLDEVMHGGVEVKYDEVATQIDEALLKLETLVPAEEVHAHENVETP